MVFEGAYPAPATWSCSAREAATCHLLPRFLHSVFRLFVVPPVVQYSGCSFNYGGFSIMSYQHSLRFGSRAICCLYGQTCAAEALNTLKIRSTRIINKSKNENVNMNTWNTCNINKQLEHDKHTLANLKIWNNCSWVCLTCSHSEVLLVLLSCGSASD